MEPKFLIVVDRHLDGGKEYNILDHLEFMVDGTPSLEKVIIVPSRRETLSMDISHIRNSCFIDNFLETGKLQDGSVPPLVFEQLPSSHPVFLSFTSGTTGIVKGVVHSAK
ncbi:acetoacetyl-CoA synthetase-like, partial [Parasteatoda tepidariorum]